LLDTLYNLYGGGDAYIRRDQNFLQVVQHFIVDGRLADNCFSKPGEEAFLGLGQTRSSDSFLSLEKRLNMNGTILAKVRYKKVPDGTFKTCLEDDYFLANVSFTNSAGTILRGTNTLPFCPTSRRESPSRSSYRLSSLN